MIIEILFFYLWCSIFLGLLNAHLTFFFYEEIYNGLWYTQANKETEIKLFNEMKHTKLEKIQCSIVFFVISFVPVLNILVTYILVTIILKGEKSVFLNKIREENLEEKEEKEKKEQMYTDDFNEDDYTEI